MEKKVPFLTRDVRTAWLMWCWVLEPITKGSGDNRKSGVRPLTPWIPVFQLLLYSLTLSSPPLSPFSLLGPFPLLQPHLSLCHPVLLCLPAIPLSQHCRTYFHLFVSSSPSVRSTYVPLFAFSSTISNYVISAWLYLYLPCPLRTDPLCQFSYGIQR